MRQGVKIFSKITLLSLHVLASMKQSLYGIITSPNDDNSILLFMVKQKPNLLVKIGQHFSQFFEQP